MKTEKQSKKQQKKQTNQEGNKQEKKKVPKFHNSLTKSKGNKPLKQKEQIQENKQQNQKEVQQQKSKGNVKNQKQNKKNSTEIVNKQEKVVEKQQEVKQEKIEIVPDIDMTGFSRSKKKKLRRKQKQIIDGNNPTKKAYKQAFIPEEGLIKKAETLYLEQAKKALQNYKLSKGDEKWMKKIMDTGTLKDRMSAIQIYVKENPKHTLPSLENLLSLCSDKNRKEGLVAQNSLKELFISCILKKEKLQSFAKNLQSKNGEYSDNDLIEFYYEQKIKEIYLRYIDLTIKGMNDPLSFYKKQNMNILFELVGNRPEQEEYIVSALVNKFGETDKTLITHLNKEMSTLLYKQGRLTWQVIKEIQGFIFRKNIGLTQQFYAINYLNTLNVKTLSSENIKDLIEFLLKLFKRILDNDQEDLLTSKLLSQILRGVNKLFPITKKNFGDYKDFYNDKIDDLFRLVNVTPNFKIRIQTLLFIFQVQSQTKSLSDRYYRVLYEMIQTQEISSTTLHELFFDILYFSLKADFNINRVKAFLKRLLQTAIVSDAPFAITSLIFISKIQKIHPSLSSLYNHSEKFYAQEDEEEHFQDQQSDDEENENKEKKSEEKQQENQIKTGYDAFKREPLYANAQESSLWELICLQKHSHPTIQKFATTILNGQYIEYKSNPLIDFTLANFLDRFSLKRSKLKQSAGRKQLIAKGKLRMSKMEEELSVSNVMSKIKSGTMREEEKYFIKYFQQKQKKEEFLGKKEKKQVRRNEDGEIMDEEDEIDEFVDELFEKKLKDNNLDSDEEDLDYLEEGFDDEDLNEDENDDDEEYEDFEDNGYDDTIDYGKTNDNEEDEEDDEEEDDNQIVLPSKSKKLTKKQIQEMEQEFEEDPDFDEELANAHDLDDEDDMDDDLDDFGALLEKAGHDEIEEQEKFKKSKLTNKKKQLQEKKEERANLPKGSKILGFKSRKIAKRGPGQKNSRKKNKK